MVVDTSALAAILFSEPERDRFIDLIDLDPSPKLSAATLVEAGMVIEGRLGADGGAQLDALVRDGGITVVGLDAAQAAIARKAWRTYGKGRHPARLNLGDCYAYALASTTGEKLLFKGQDFTQTDIVAAI